MNMETKQKTNVFPLIAGVVFALMALRQIVNLVRHFSVIGLLYLAMEILMAVVLIVQKRDVLLLAATSFLTVLKLYALANSVGSFRFFIMRFLELLSVLALLALVILMTTNAAVQYREKVKQVWFVPIILSGVYFIVNLFGGNFFGVLLNAAGYALAAIWVACPEGLSKEAGYTATRATVTVEGVNGEFVGGTIPGAQHTAAGGSSDDGYVDMAACVLLLLLTCGVYLYIWIYRTAKFLNFAEGEEQSSPAAQLLLCMFIPFYYIYWIYKSAQRVDALAKINGIDSNITTLCLILAIFVPIVAPMIMQDKINGIVKSQKEPGSGAATYGASAAAEPYAPAQTELGVAAELKTYKELLDSGAITQEEFDRKKKQLLDE